MQHLVTSSFHSDLDLLFQLLNLIQCIVKLHLKIVALKNYRLEVHLLPSDDVLLQNLPLLLDLFHLLHLLGASLLQIGYPAENFLNELHAVFKVPFSVISHILEDVHLLLEVMILLLKLLSNFYLLRREVAIDLLQHKHLR